MTRNVESAENRGAGVASASGSKSLDAPEPIQDFFPFLNRCRGQDLVTLVAANGSSKLVSNVSFFLKKMIIQIFTAPIPRRSADPPQRPKMSAKAKESHMKRNSIQNKLQLSNAEDKKTVLALTRPLKELDRAPPKLYPVACFVSILRVTL